MRRVSRERLDVLLSGVVAVFLLSFFCTLPASSRADPASVWMNSGADILNSRFQQHSMINSHTVSTMMKTTTFSYVNASTQTMPQGSVSCTPVIWGNYIYYVDFNGNLICYDKWGQLIYQKSISSLYPSNNRPDTYARASPSLCDSYLFIGTSDTYPNSPGSFVEGALVIRVDRETGDNSLYTIIDSATASKITQSGVFFDGSYYIGVSTDESLYAGTIPGYQCCNFRGSFHKLNADLDERWAVSTISPFLPGGPLGFSGGSVWGSSPPISVNHETVYIGTGQNHQVPQYIDDCVQTYGPDAPQCEVYGNRIDSIIAMNTTTGDIVFTYTADPYDAWNVACIVPGNPNNNCPPEPGLDADFGMAPILIPSQYHHCEEICKCSKYEQNHHHHHYCDDNDDDECHHHCDNPSCWSSKLCTSDWCLNNEWCTRLCEEHMFNITNISHDDRVSHGFNIINSISKLMYDMKDYYEILIEEYISPQEVDAMPFTQLSSFAPSCQGKQCAPRLASPCTSCPVTELSTDYTVIGETLVTINLGTTIVGDVALTLSNPIIGVPPNVIIGTVEQNNPMATAVKDEVNLIMNALFNCQCDATLPDPSLMLPGSNITLTPGTWCTTQNWILPVGVNVVYDNQGNTNAVLNIRSTRQIILLGGNTIYTMPNPSVDTCNINLIAQFVVTTTSNIRASIYASQGVVLTTTNMFGKIYLQTNSIRLVQSTINYCQCKSEIPPSVSATPSMSPSMAPSSIPSGPCVGCDRLSLANSYGIAALASIINFGNSVINSNVATVIPLVGFPPGIVTGLISINTLDYLTVMSEINSEYDRYTSCCQSPQGNTTIGEATPVTIYPGYYCYSNLIMKGTVVLNFTDDPLGTVVIVADEITILSGFTMMIVGNGCVGTCNIYIVSKHNINLGDNLTLFGTFISLYDITQTLDTGLTSSLDGHFYSVTGIVTVVNLLQKNCPCFVPPSFSSTPSMSRSVSVTPSITPTISLTSTATSTTSSSSSATSSTTATSTSSTTTTASSSTTPSVSPSASRTITSTPTPTRTPCRPRKCPCKCRHGRPHNVRMYDMLVIGQKNGIAHGVNGQNGTLVWATQLGPGGTLGGSSWGAASDLKRYAYFNIINNEAKPFTLYPSMNVTYNGGWCKVDIENGAIMWCIGVPDKPDDPNNPLPKWATGPPALANDILITTSTDGYIYFINTLNGSIEKMEKYTDKGCYGGASLDNKSCAYVGEGYTASFGFPEGNSVYSYCLNGTALSYN